MNIRRSNNCRRILALLLSGVLLAGLPGCVNREEKATGAAKTPETAPPVQTIAPTPTPEPTPEPTPTPEPEPTPDPNTYNDRLTKEGPIFGYINERTDASISNMELACSILDGVKIEPGETFSFLDALGPVTAERGFSEAEVYGGHANEEEEIHCLGGGISMVSSVIYSASLYAVLTPVERYPHKYYLSVNSNLRWGCDAYTDETKDLKIKNDYPFPVQLKVWVERDSEKICCDIYGTNPEGLYAVPKHSLTSDYLSPPLDFVCIGFWNDMVRQVYNSSGFVREDSLNYDYDGDGTPEQDYYLRFEADIVWH